MFVVGGREMEQGAVAVRDRIDGDLGSMPLEAAIAKLQEEVRARTVRQVAKAAAVAPVSQAEEHAY